MAPTRASRPGSILGLAAALLALAAGPAAAGPPYLTDDPQPTDPGHWEIYNFVTATRSADGLDGEAGVDLNYGAAKDLQLTAVLPLAFGNPDSFAIAGLSGGTGVIELAGKYKLVHQSAGGLAPDVSVFPRLFVPTSQRFGPPNPNLLLPVWAEKDFGPWSLFGGGGYQINPGKGERDFWQGGVALSRTIGKRASLGAEVYGQSDDSAALPGRPGGGYRAVNIAATYRLVTHWSLLASAGPTRQAGGGWGAVFYMALKADY